MDNQFIEIEQFAKLSGLSVSTIRRKIKSLSESNKNAFIRRVPVVGSGGDKILIDKAWLSMMNKHEQPLNDDLNKHEYATNDDVSKHDEPLTDKKDDTSGQQSEPEDDKIKNGSSQSNDTSIIDILRGQIEYLQKQSEIKDGQISDLSKGNIELLERLKEVNYTLANAQKQLSAPVEERPGDLPKWWQFWK